MRRNVVVAGGTSGINFTIAQRFASGGDRVAVISRTQSKVDTAVDALGGEDDALGVAADVRDAAAIDQAVATVSRTWGQIDVVIAGAAGNFVANAEDMSANAFKTVVDIDLLGTFNVFRSAWEHLRKPGASLISITAAQSWLPTHGQAHVGAAKAGVDQLTRTLALEWGRAGVRVNALAPGPVEGTEGMARLAPTSDSLRAWKEAVPLGRMANADEIAKVAHWMSSPSAAYITGVVLSVDGGLSLSGSAAFTSALENTSEGR